MSVTHVAGPPISYNGRGVQRCMVCGEKLIDTLRMQVPIRPDGTVPTVAFWEPGHLIRNVKGHSADVGDYAEADVLPSDICWALVEE